MPLGKIEVRQLTQKELLWREKWKQLEGVDIAPILRHMSREEYFSWTYAIDPRSALVLSTEPVYRDILAYQRSKRWYHEVRDWVWRKRYGNR